MSASPAHRAALSARAKAQWADPQKRALMMAGKLRHWTEEMNAALVAARRDELSWEKTAERLGVALSAAYFQSRRLGLTGERGARAG